jgi:hypothetical protein
MYRIFQLIIQALSSGLFAVYLPVWGVLGVFMSPKSRKKDYIMSSYSGCFVKLIFSAEFHSVPIFGIGSSAEIGGMSTFFRGITETIPSLFRGIFSERNFVPNPSYAMEEDTVTEKVKWVKVPVN